MNIYINPDPSQWEELLKRPQIDNDLIRPQVETILAKVKQQGDKALFRYAKELDGASLTSLAVSPEEMKQATADVDPEVADAIRQAARNIEKFHRAQLFPGIEVHISEGITCSQRSVPIRKVGLYIPGGSAPLFSTVLMLAIPAQIAGCGEVVLCSPPDKSGRIAAPILFAAELCGVNKIFKAGGAQAIGAMAYGTDSIPKADKIFGPGNLYVTVAKQLASVSDVAIDMPAGPSEVLVMADDTADARFVAADLLSQAEHGPDSQAILVAGSEKFARKVSEQVDIQLKSLTRAELAEKSIANSRIFVLHSREKMIELANSYAAEHLIISMRDAWEAAEKITAAGSVFIGNYTPESAGDYASGTNHTLPTHGWATAYSGVNLDSFMRKITYQEISREGLKGLEKTIRTMALAEGLDAHANAVRIRLEED